MQRCIVRWRNSEPPHRLVSRKPFRLPTPCPLPKEKERWGLGRASYRLPAAGFGAGTLPVPNPPVRVPGEGATDTGKKVYACTDVPTPFGVVTATSTVPAGRLVGNVQVKLVPCPFT